MSQIPSTTQRHGERTPVRTRVPNHVVSLRPKENPRTPTRDDDDDSSIDDNYSMTPSSPGILGYPNKYQQQQQQKRRQPPEYYSYGIPDQSPAPSTLFRRSPATSSTSAKSISFPSNPRTPTDEEIYMDDVSSRCSNLSSLEEHGDMYLFATTAANILQKASEDTSPTYASIESLSSSDRELSQICGSTCSTPSLPCKEIEEDTPIVKNGSTPILKNTERSNTTQDEKKIIDWGKFMYFKMKGSSPLSLPSMLGAPSSTRSNCVSELESPGFFLESEDKSDIHSKSQATADLQSSPTLPYHSVQKNKVKEDNVQSFRHGDVSNNMLLPTSDEHDNDNVDEELCFGQATPSPSRRNLGSSRATMVNPAIVKPNEKKGPFEPNDEEMPPNDCDNEEVVRDKETANKHDCCCYVPLRFRLLGLFVLATALIVTVLVGFLGKNAVPMRESESSESSLEPVSSSPTSSPTEFPPTVMPSVMTSQRPTTAPTLSPQRPTSPADSPIARPSDNSPVSQRPSSSPVNQTVGPSLPPIWTDILQGEEDLHDSQVEDVHWPHYYSKTGLRLEIIDALEDHWQPAFHVVIENWSAFPMLDLIVDKHKYDEPCDPFWAKLKICNKNFGDVGWRGMVQLYIRSGNVVASTIHFNDYYSIENGWDQYTICHQLGHAFGLPDSEGSNCMKFVNPETLFISTELRSPDFSIGETLRDYYGEETGQRKLKGKFRQSLNQEGRNGRPEETDLMNGNFQVLRIHV